MATIYKHVKCILFSILMISISTQGLALMDPHMQSAPPDTGQTGDYTYTFGEDSDYSIRSMSFTKLDSSGNALSESATEWAMVRDNVTGLVWEAKKAKDYSPDYNNIHDADNVYTWYDLNPDTNGGVAGTAGDGTDTLDFINAINKERLGGYSDWRIPTKEELRSILDLGRYSPSTDTIYFPSTMESYYWASTTVASDPGSAWKVSFEDGLDYIHDKSSDAYHVRAVRSGSSRLSGNLISNGDGTVTDFNTGLMWQETSSGEPMDWENALYYAENLTLAKRLDWRLPTPKELATIASMDSTLSPAYKTEFFNDYNTVFWSSTTYVMDTSMAWIFNYETDAAANTSYKTDQHYVRCVRESGGIQSLSKIAFSSSLITVGESDGYAAVTVTRTGTTSDALTVGYTIYGGTAILNSDYYLPATGVLTWAAGESGDRTFNLPIINDDIEEANETVNIYLTNASDPASVVAPASTIVSIIDDDTKGSLISFGQNSYIVNESRSSIQIPVKRSQSSAGTVAVTFSVKADGTTASEGSDFTLPVSRTLLWGDGDTSDKFIDIAIIDDRMIEQNEFIVLGLSVSVATGDVLIEPYPETTVNIVDNELSDIKDVVDITDEISGIQNEEEASDITDRLDSDIEFIQSSMPSDTGVTPSEDVLKAIDVTIKNIARIIETSNTLLGSDKIGTSQALKTLINLDNIMAIAGTAASADGEVDISSVAGSLSPVENLVSSAISGSATSGEMSGASGHIESIMVSMPKVMNAAIVTDDVVNLLEPMKSLAGAGIDAALAGGRDPAGTVKTLGSTVSKGLHDATDAGVVGNTGRIILSAGGIVSHAVSNLKRGTESETIISGVLEQLQTELDPMLSQTADNIKGKTVPANSTTSKALGNFRDLMGNVSYLTESIVRMKAVLTPQLVGTMRDLSDETMKNILPAFIAGSDVGKLISSYPQLIDEVTRIASVDLTPGMVISSADIARTVQQNSSLTSAQKLVLINGLPELPSADQGIIRSGSISFTLADLLERELSSIPGTTTVQPVSVNGLYLMVMVENRSIGLKIPIYIKDARVVSSELPDKLYSLPEGDIVLVRNGIAAVLAPAPLDSTDILLSLDSILGPSSGTKNSLKVTDSGALNLKFDNGSIFRGNFGYGVFKEGDGNFNAGTSSFEVSGTDPATEAYAILVVYDDDTTQQITPSISALEQLVAVLDKLVAGSYSIDRNTGILNVLGFLFKPSYLIETATTSSARSWFNDNQKDGIAFESEDYNGDSVADLKMWSSEVEDINGIPATVIYKQVIYTVVQ